MIVQPDPPLHLTYCLNIHPGETWEEAFAAIRDHTLRVREQLGAESPFGLGLRLSNTAARELIRAPCREAFRGFLKEHALYLFTINGFPFGAFHGERVKENVYAPDWRSRERVDYTKILAALLADLIEEGAGGSISTVPCSFKTWVRDAGDVATMVEHLMETVAYLAHLASLTGRDIHLGLEPEPACFLETTDDALTFFSDVLLVRGRDLLRKMLGCSPAVAEKLIFRHLGVCLDTCHAAVQFEDPLSSLQKIRAAGIRLSKIQISAALAMPVNAQTVRTLEPFAEETYLHQVVARGTDGARHAWVDLPDALSHLTSWPDLEEVRVHYHIPLFWPGQDELGSTAALLGTSFFDAVREGYSSHLEVETYTFDVLPPDLREGAVHESVAREVAWVRERLRLRA